MFKRFISMTLALIMVFGIMPISVMAEEWQFPGTSIAVKNQTLTVYFLLNNKYIEKIAECPIEDGKVNITIPYIPNSVVDSKYDKARLAFHISDGYSGEGKDNVTHFMGGFGEDIMEYVNWQETYENGLQKERFNDFNGFLDYHYWPFDIMGDVDTGASVIKKNIVRYYKDELRRYIDSDEPFSDRLYIQYFDASAKEVVAYEHIDVTINMAEDTVNATRMPFSQVSFNGFNITEENLNEKIGYGVGVNSYTGELVVDMTKEQLNNATPDEYGNLYTHFKFSAPSNNVTKYYRAKGVSEILNIKNVPLEDFSDYDYSEGKVPEIKDPLGYFDDEGFFPEFTGDNNTHVYIAWYDGEEITYQYFNLVRWIEPDEENEGEGEGEGGNQSNFEIDYATWEGKFVNPNQVSLDIPKSFKDAVTLSFDKETAVVTFDVSKVSVEDWISAYGETGGTDNQIRMYINVSPTKTGIDEAYDTNGGLFSLKNFISNSKNANHYIFDEGSSSGGWGHLGQIFRKDGKVTIIPSVNQNTTYFAVAWYDTDGVDENNNPIEPVYMIMPYRFEIIGNTKSFTFDDTINYVDYDRIIFDSNTKVTTSFSSAPAELTYKYTYSGTVDSNTPKFILNDIFGNDTSYRFVTQIKAPDGYKEKGESDYNTIYPINTRCEAEGVICGSSQTYAVEWEIIDKTKISDSKPEYITEYLTIDFDPGIVFAEILWEPITDLSRITYYRQNEDPLDESVLINGGLTMSLSNGKFHAGFDITREFDVYNVPNAMISIAPPNDGVEYVAFKINESGGGSKNYYDPWKPVDQDVVIQGGDFFDITDWRTRCLNIAYFRCENIDGIDVWYTGNAGGEQTMIIDWYTSTDENAKPAKREFIYVKYEDYLNKATTSSVTKEELKENYGTGVTEATPIGENWKLNVNHYPQSKYNDEYAYYFQLEATGEVPEGKKIIYIPYSYIDEDLDYEKALELKLHPKLKHYDDSHNEKEKIDGVLTPYGMMFVVSDFSPFIIEAVTSTANVASIGETAYGSLKAALAAAKSGDTIKLISDTNEETVTINDEITLDLNGYKLTAGSFISIGKIVDNSKAKTGILNVLENVAFNSGNGQMPLLTEEGYVFANIRHQTFVVDSATTATTFALDVRPAFGTKFTQYLSDNGGTDNKISIVINLKWDGGSMDFRFSDELTAKVYAQSGKTMRINVSGVTEEIGKVIATVKVLSDTGVVIESKEYVFPDHFTK